MIMIMIISISYNIQLRFLIYIK